MENAMGLTLFFFIQNLGSFNYYECIVHTNLDIIVLRHLNMCYIARTLIETIEK